jgi:hypothetical protein
MRIRANEAALKNDEIRMTKPEEMMNDQMTPIVRPVFSFYLIAFIPVIGR